jgi:hypothetical protein
MAFKQICFESEAREKNSQGCDVVGQRGKCDSRTKAEVCAY